MSQRTLTGSDLSDKTFEVELAVDDTFTITRTIEVDAPDGNPREQVDVEEYAPWEVGIRPGKWGDAFGSVMVIAKTEPEAKELAVQEAGSRKTEAYDTNWFDTDVEIVDVEMIEE